MASFRKRGDCWRAEVVKNGIRDSATFSTKREAVDWASQREAEIADGSGVGIVSKPLRDVLARYRDEVSPRNKGHVWERARVNRFLRDEADKQLLDKPMHQVLAGDLAAWRDRRLSQVKPASVRREVALWRSMWRVARLEWRHVKVDVWPQVKIPPKGKPRERIFTDQEVQRICACLGYFEGERMRDGRQQTAVALLLALETAMRSGELVHLRWADVDLPRRIVHLEDTKNGDRRQVPLSKRAVMLFEQLRGNDPSAVFTISDALRDVYYRQGRTMARVSGVTFHDSRATALTRLAKKLDVLDLARMVGHRDPRSLMIYYRESATNIAQRLD